MVRWPAVVGLGVAVALWAREAQALEERFGDLTASVEVAPVFGVSLDQPHLTFGELGPGETVILGEGRFFNEVRCRSNSGRPWFLKAHLLSLKALQRAAALPASSLQWKLVESIGAAESVGARWEFQPLPTEPVLIYAAGAGDDLRGMEIVLRFQYSLTAPLDAPAGTYVGQLIFTMAEGP